MKKCKCERLKKAAIAEELKTEFVVETCLKCGSIVRRKPNKINYYLCVIEGIESQIYFCPWCGGEL